MIVQTSNQNDKYLVIDDIFDVRHKKRYLTVQNIKSGFYQEIPIGYYAGKKRCIVSKTVLNDSDENIPHYIVGKIIGTVILIEEW